jgi:hypothetical protein
MTSRSKRREAPYLWILNYRRADWAWAQRRYWMSEEPARRYIARLKDDGPEWDHLSPLVELQLIRRVLGDVEIVEKFRRGR